MHSKDDKRPVVVITGANGYVGSYLVEYFSKKNWQVRALVRQPGKYKSSKNVDYIFYDISKEFDAASIFKGASYLIHAAYVKGSSQTAYDINVEGAKRLTLAVKKYKLLRSVFISSMSAHGKATSVYGHQKLAIEKIFTDVKGTVLKCGLIIGDGGIVKDMSEFMAKWHVVPLIDGGKQPLQIVAVSDLVNVIDKVIVKDIKGTYVIANPDVYSYREFYKELAKSRKINVAFIPVPYGLLMSLLKIAAVLHLPLDLGADNLKGLKQLVSMDSDSDLKKLDVQLLGLDEALEIMV